MTVSYNTLFKIFRGEIQLKVTGLLSTVTSHPEQFFSQQNKYLITLQLHLNTDLTIQQIYE